MRLLALLALFSSSLLVAQTAQQETPRHKFWRRALMITACAATAYEGYQTVKILNRTDPTGQGYLQGKAMFTLQATTCVAPLIASTFHMQNMSLWSSTVGIGLETGLILFNRTTLNNLQQQRQPGILAK